MAISARKISNFQTLNSELSGEEFLMVAYKGRSYKLPIKLLLGNKIESFVQEIYEGDDEDGKDNPITITLSDGTSKVFHVYNGKTGKQGKQGKQGKDGDPGDAVAPIYNLNSLEAILNLLVTPETINNYSEDELKSKIVNGALGQQLTNAIEDLNEVYLNSQEEFEELERTNQIKENTKYFIFE